MLTDSASPGFQPEIFLCTTRSYQGLNLEHAKQQLYY